MSINVTFSTVTGHGFTTGTREDKGAEDKFGGYSWGRLL